MTDMPTIAEALEALTTLRRFTEGLRTVVGPLANAPAQKRRRYRWADGRPTWKEMISAILETEAPLPPLGITRRVLQRYEVGTDRVATGHHVRSTLHHMKRDGTVACGPGGYVLTQRAEDR